MRETVIRSPCEKGGALIIRVRCISASEAACAKMVRLYIDNTTSPVSRALFTEQSDISAY